MAITTIHPIKSTLRKALDYICSPEKTDGQLLVSSFGCAAETADIEFNFTRQSAMEKGNNLAHHMIQSFEPGEITPEQAHEIGRQLAEQTLGGQYEYVLTTHIDKGHVHNHIIFNSVDFMTYHKYNSNNRTRYQIRNASDKLCKENGLSVIHSENWKSKKAIGQHHAEKSGKGWKEQIKKAIDECIPLSKDFDDFLKRMEANGYEIKRAKYASYKPKGKGRFTGGPTLGEAYSNEQITERIAALNKPMPTVKTKVFRPENKNINLLIDIQNNLKAKENKGYEHWAKINNLKQAAKTVKFLTENNLENYDQLEAKVESLHKTDVQTAQSIKAIEKRLADMALFMKYIETYQQTKPVYEQCKSSKAKNNLHFQKQQQIILHEASRKALKSMQVDGKLPNPKTVKADYERLQKEKEILYQKYKEVKREVKKFDTIKSNIDQILSVDSLQRIHAQTNEEQR